MTSVQQKGCCEEEEHSVVEVLHDIWSNISPCSYYNSPLPLSFALSTQDLNHVLNNKFSFFSGNSQGDWLESTGNVFLRQGRDVTVEDFCNLHILGHPIVAIGCKDLTSNELSLINLRMSCQAELTTLGAIWTSLKKAPYVMYYMPQIALKTITEEYYDSNNIFHWEELLVEQQWLPNGFTDSLELSAGRKRLIMELLLNYTSTSECNANRNWDSLVRTCNAITCIFGVLDDDDECSDKTTATPSPFARLLENVCNRNVGDCSKSIAIHRDSASNVYLYAIEVPLLNLSLEIGSTGIVCRHIMSSWELEEEDAVETNGEDNVDLEDVQRDVGCWESVRIGESSLGGSIMGYLLIPTISSSILEFRIGASLHLIAHFEYYGVSPQKVLESGMERWSLGKSDVNDHISRKHDGAYIDTRDVDTDDGYWKRLMRNFSLRGVEDVLSLEDWLAWIGILSLGTQAHSDDDEWDNGSYDEDDARRDNDVDIDGYTEGYKHYVGQGSGHLFQHLYVDYTVEYEQMNSPSLLLLSCCDSTTFRRNDAFIFDVKLLLYKICPGLLVSLGEGGYVNKYLADITLSWWMDFNDWTSVRKTMWRSGECGEYYIHAETGALIFSLPPTHNHSDYLRGNQGDVVFDANVDEFGHYVINYAPHDFAERNTPVLTSFGHIEQQNQQPQQPQHIMVPDWIENMIHIVSRTFGITGDALQDDELWTRVFAPRFILPMDDEVDCVEAQNVSTLLKHPETAHPLLVLEIVRYSVDRGGGEVDVVSSYWPNVPNRLIKFFTRDHWRRGQYLFDHALLCISVRTHVNDVGLQSSKGNHKLKPAKYLLVAITTKTFDDRRTGLYPDYFTIWILFDSSKDDNNDTVRSISLVKLETRILPYAQACVRMR